LKPETMEQVMVWRDALPRVGRRRAL